MGHVSFGTDKTKTGCRTPPAPCPGRSPRPSCVGMIIWVRNQKLSNAFLSLAFLDRSESPLGTLTWKRKSRGHMETKDVTEGKIKRRHRGKDQNRGCRNTQADPAYTQKLRVESNAPHRSPRVVDYCTSQQGAVGKHKNSLEFSMCAAKTFVFLLTSHVSVCVSEKKKCDGEKKFSLPR